MQQACGVWRQVTEIPVRAQPDSPAAVHRDRSDDARSQKDFAPGNAIELEDRSCRDAKVHESTTVLQDRPDLTGAVVILGRIVLEKGCSYYSIGTNWIAQVGLPVQRTGKRESRQIAQQEYSVYKRRTVGPRGFFQSLRLGQER